MAPGASTSSGHREAHSRIPEQPARVSSRTEDVNTPAYVGKPPKRQQWRRSYVGKRPPSPLNPAKANKKSCVASSASESDRGLLLRDEIAARDTESVSMLVADTSRGVSPEIPLDESLSGNGSRATSRMSTRFGSNNVEPSLSITRDISSKARRGEYFASQEETSENEGLVVHNETQTCDARSSDDLPVRLLHEFSIYEMRTKRLIDFSTLHLDITNGSRREYGASGFVEPFFDEDEEEQDEDLDDGAEDSSLPSTESPLRIALSLIVDVNIHHVDTSGGDFQLNKRVYLQTEFAWYILVEPEPQYADFYAPFHIQHGLFHELLISSLASVAQEQDLSLEEFKQTINTLETAVSQAQLLITSDYLDCCNTLRYIAQNFEILSEDHEEVLAPLRKISALAVLLQKAWDFTASPSTVFQPTLAAIQKEVVENASKIVVTPTVHKLCNGFFPSKHLQLVNFDEDTMDLDTPPDPPASWPRQNHIQARCKWKNAIEVSPHHYRSIVLDDVQYDVGDTVLVLRGGDKNSRRARHAESLRTGDILSDDYWFAKICYMFERKESVELSDGSTKHTYEKYFHGQWYYHGSKTLLHEMTHPRALFPTNECDDNSVFSIVQKLKVKPGLDVGLKSKALAHDDVFYSGLLWDQTRVAFCEMQPEEIEAAREKCSRGEECVSCGLRQIRLEKEAWDVKVSQLSRGGVDFHIHDFVYLRPDTPDASLYVIGQITKVELASRASEPHRLRVRVFERYDTLAGGDNTYHGPKDERCLVWTDSIVPFEIACVEGKLFAAHPRSLKPNGLEDWIKHDDHFLVKWKIPASQGRDVAMSELQHLPRCDFYCCDECYAERRASLRKEDKLLGNYGPLRCMELFAGAGGLATGLDQSGFVETKWAIELASSAASSFASNHPSCTVYNQCTNVMLQHAVDTHHGRKPRRRLFSRNNLDRDPLPDMPKRGDVDFISGGPPCQSFSGANHYKKADDIRTSLICNQLSYVEFYRPIYFLLENVVGLLSYRTLGKGDVKMGMVKFISGTLLALGYQVHCKVLQAAHYGTPQGRERVIFWGAKRGVPLPDFPFLTHLSSREGRNYKLPTGEILYRPVRLMPSSMDINGGSEYRQYALFHAVTIDDAIGDLPKFDWLDPRIIIRPRAGDAADRLERKKKGILSYPAIVNRGIGDAYSGYDDGKLYLHEPRNRYQIQAREGLDNNDGVRYHYTNRYSAKIVERVVNVPLEPNANHTDLPVGLRDPRRCTTTDARIKKAYARHYGRLDADGQFRTTITTVNPNSMNGCVLHPSQKRVLTVRECARAQGFPDSYVLESTQTVPAKKVEDRLRQIGNAVPVPLALALGKELGKALIKMWTQEEEKLRLSPEVPMDVNE